MPLKRFNVVGVAYAPQKKLRKNNVIAAYIDFFQGSLLGQYGYQLVKIFYLNYVFHLVSKLI